MTGRDTAVPATLRVVLAAVVAVDLLSFYLFIGDARADAPAVGGWIEVGSRPLVAGAVALLGIAATVAFARRAGRLWEGVLALAALILLSTVHTQLAGSPWRHLFFSGLCLSGWLLGLVLQRWRGDPQDESYARAGATALLGAAYLSSGISKVVYGGSAWFSGLPVQAAIIGQQGLVPDGMVEHYRAWVVTTPAVASLLAWATAAFELAGPLMLLGRRARLCVALALLGMHANVYVLTTHILYWESMVLLLAFGLAPDATPGSAAEASAPPSSRSGRGFAVAALLLSLCALAAVGRQTWLHAHADDALETVDARPAPTPTLPPLRRLGPFAVGDTIAATWSIESIEPDGEGFTVTLTAAPGRARFWITCSPLPHRSPFDVGGAHVLYPNDVELRDVEPPGRALQTKLRDAAEGGDVCERLRTWLAAALAGGAVAPGDGS